MCSKKILAIISMASALTLVGCSTSTRPGAVQIHREQLLLLDAQTMEQIGEASYSSQNNQARAQGKLIVSGPQFERLKKIAKRIIPHAKVFRDDAEKWNWDLVLINNPQINATCAPGGRITFYTGIINRLKNLSDDEIAMVMGHEISHALREHTRERLSEAQLQGGLVDIALGVTKNKEAQIQAANQITNILYKLPNSREHESEADIMGLELAARAGYNPNASVSVWKKIADATPAGSNPPEFLSTHPSHGTRIATLSRYIPTVMPLYQNALRAQRKR